MLNVVVLSVTIKPIMLSVIMLNVVAPKDILPDVDKNDVLRGASKLGKNDITRGQANYSGMPPDKKVNIDI